MNVDVASAMMTSSGSVKAYQRDVRVMKSAFEQEQQVADLVGQTAQQGKSRAQASQGGAVKGSVIDILV